MIYFRLLIYLSFILFIFYRLGQCGRFQYDLELDYVRIENTQKKWKSIFLSKYTNLDKFIFSDAQLNRECDGAFSSSNVEIVEVFNRAMRFSFILRTNDQLFINLLFSEKSAVQLFFGDIRSHQREGCGSEVKVEKLFQYQIYYTGDNKKPLTLLSRHVVSYPKNLGAHWLANPKSFNFSVYGYSTRFQGVQLVMLSKTFNISSKIDGNVYVLCSANIPTHLFILLFPDALSADNFYSSVENDVDGRILCLHDWITLDILHEIKSY